MSAEAHAGRFCAVHTAAPAATVCARCGRFCCLDCTAPRGNAWFCKECLGRVDEERAGSWFALTAAICSFAGVAVAPLAVAGLLLAITDLVRMTSGKSPKSGWKLDVFAIVAGAAGVTIGVLIVQRLWLRG